MRVLLPPDHARHDPDAVVGAGVGARPYWERPARVTALLDAVRGAGLLPETPPRHDLGPIAAVHDTGYLEFLATAHAAWRALPGRAEDLAVRPTAFAVRPLDRRPDNVAGLAGWYLAGTGAPILEHTWAAARVSADAAIAGADLLLGGAREAYALCRPPGHHAHADLAGGFCFLNNTAIAAARLLAGSGGGRVAVLDIDVHHGNGTQAIFYDQDAVQTVSVHGDPAGLYPFYAGYADETGRGAGLGWNRNLPLPPGSDDSAWLAAIETGLETIATHGAPAALVVALGLDARAGDPTANLAVGHEGFRGAGQRIGALGVPTLLVQEGGYLVDHLAATLDAFLDGFLGTRRPAPAALPPRVTSAAETPP